MSNIQIIEKDILGLRERFGSVLSDASISFDREAEFAVQILAQNDYALGVAMKNRQSVIDAVTNVAAIGVSLNPAKKHAYLVPRDRKICLDISYMGLMAIATDSGAIKWGQARVVYEQDVFEVNGIDREPTHRFQPFAKERGEVVGAYCVVKTRDGDYLTEAMSIDEINDIRDRSSSWKAWIKDQKKSPWVTDENEMRKKTVVKRAHKYWPSTERLANAIHYMNTDGGEGLDTTGGAPTLPDDCPPDLLASATAAASCGLMAYREFWGSTGAANRKLLEARHEGLKAKAEQADAERTVDA